MDYEPFVMKSVDRAREWVDAYSKSAQEDKEDSARTLAMLCGFGSWDVMVFAIETLPPTACDEEVGQDEVLRRIKAYMHVLVGLENIRPPIAMYFIHRLSPSASYPYAAIERAEALDVEAALENSDTDEEDFVTEIDHVRLHTCSRMCTEVNVEGWLMGLEYLGWDVDVDTIDEEADIGEPSFEVLDDEIGRLPVYLSGLTRIPETDGDPGARAFLKACLGDFILNGYDSGALLVLWQHPQHKEIAGRAFCCIGVSYSTQQDSWKDMLVNVDCSSPGRFFQLNDMIQPDFDVELLENYELEDADRKVCCSLAVILGGNADRQPPEEGWKMQINLNEDTGWGCVRLSVEDEPDTE